MFEKIKKRDGRVVEFDSPKITAAIARAGNATGEFEQREARKLTLRALTLAHELRPGPVPEVEEMEYIQDKLFTEIEFGILKDETRKGIVSIIEKMAERHKAQGVVLGCTELPLIIKKQDVKTGYLDPTAIHISSIVRECRDL